jgi:hypothetical protein
MATKLKRWLKDTDAFELGAIIFIVVGIVLVMIAIGLGIKSKITLEGGEGWDNITTYSEFIAGLIGGVWSLAGVLLFYSSLSSQKADLEAQKDLLVKQIDEVVAQTKEFRIQNEMAKDQKNEETFFQLLRFHNEIITSIELEQADMDFATGQNEVKTIVGRKAFVEYYDIFKRFFGEASENIRGDSQENLAKLFDTCYNTFYLEYQADLGHYFRNLYNLLRYIKGVKKETQPFFLSLLIAQLSNYELTMLFFHCLRSTNGDFKDLVEEFEVLAQVPKDEVTSMAYVLYDIKAFGDDGFGSGDVLDLDDDEDFTEDSLLGKLSQNADSMVEDSSNKASGKDFMDDLLSRLKGAQEGTSDGFDHEEEEKELIIEGEDGGDFLNEFFDKQEKEKEKKRSNLLVEKEKVDEKEKEILDINSLLSGKEADESGADEDFDLDIFMDSSQDIETSEDYSESADLEKIKEQFKSEPEKEADQSNKNDSNDLDLSMFMDSSDNDLAEEGNERDDSINSNNNNEDEDENDFDLSQFMDSDDNSNEENDINDDEDNTDDFNPDFLKDFAEDDKKDTPKQNADDLLNSLKAGKKPESEKSQFDFGKKDVENMSLDDISKKLDEDFDSLEKNRGKASENVSESKENNNSTKKSKKKVKIKPRTDDKKDIGGKGFLSKL